VDIPAAPALRDPRLSEDGPRQPSGSEWGTAGPLRSPRRLACTQYGTLRGMPKTVPVREFRTNLSELLSDVADRRDHVLVTRNGKPAAALVPIDEYEALEETAEILSDSVTLAQIETGLKELAEGDGVTLEELRRELAERRASR
jgi:antitoxin YefM